MSKSLPPGERVEFSIDSSIITGYEFTQFHYPDGKIGERLEITYFGRGNVRVTEDESMPHGSAVFQALGPISDIPEQRKKD